MARIQRGILARLEIKHLMKHWATRRSLVLSLTAALLPFAARALFGALTMRTAADHVNIAKPGALQSGWQQFALAEAAMPKLSRHAAASPLLGHLRSETDTIAENLARYRIQLEKVLSIAATSQESASAARELEHQSSTMKEVCLSLGRLVG